MIAHSSLAENIEGSKERRKQSNKPRLLLRKLQLLSKYISIKFKEILFCNSLQLSVSSVMSFAKNMVLSKHGGC
jgi:hypothetical protein